MFKSQYRLRYASESKNNAWNRHFRIDLLYELGSPPPTGGGPYANIPRFIFWKQSGETILFYGGANGGTVPPLYTPGVTTTPSGYTKTYWRDQLTLSSSHIDGLPLWQAIAEDFTPGKSELFPIDQATLDSYNGKLQQNPGY